jgi:hypothetical protein
MNAARSVDMRETLAVGTCTLRRLIRESYGVTQLVPSEALVNVRALNIGIVWMEMIPQKAIDV